LKTKKRVVIYTDGACSGNPGPGGYAAVLLYEKKRKEISGGFARTTNNRMELKAVIEALKALKQLCDVTLYSDSQYIVQAMSKGWAGRWRTNNWKRNNKEAAVNPDLWEELLQLTEKHNVEFRWIRGHAGDRENERADQLSVAASRRANLPPDPGYKPAKLSEPQL
jgi:ribonuclease HI